MNRWYRAYEGTVSDPKLGEVALVAEASRSVVIAAWHAILESAASTQDGGRFDTTPRRVAALLGEPIALVTAVFAAIEETGLTGNGVVTAWNRRQFESDSSTSRTRAWREKKKQNGTGGDDGDGGGTSLRRHRTPPEAETETDNREAASAASARARPPPDESTAGLRAEIVQAFHEVGSTAIPDTSRAAVWLAKGYRREVIVPVIREVLARKPAVATMAYFDGPLADAHANPPLKPLNGGSHGTHRAPSYRDIAEADIERLERLERERGEPGPVLRIASG